MLSPRPQGKASAWRALALLALCCLLAVGWAGPAAAAPPGKAAMVKAVYDGDTISVEFRGRVVTVRLVGVDTPETRHSKSLERAARHKGRSPREEAALGLAAKQQTQDWVKAGDLVHLESDPRQPGNDRYGRMLAYVWLPDGRMLNRELVAMGWARAVRRFDYIRKAEFIRLEDQAKSRKAGLWGRGGP